MDMKRFEELAVKDATISVIQGDITLQATDMPVGRTLQAGESGSSPRRRHPTVYHGGICTVWVFPKRGCARDGKTVRDAASPFDSQFAKPKLFRGDFSRV